MTIFRTIAYWFREYDLWNIRGHFVFNEKRATDGWTEKARRKGTIFAAVHRLEVQRLEEKQAKLVEQGAVLFLSRKKARAAIARRKTFFLERPGGIKMSEVGRFAIQNSRIPQPK